MLFNRLILNLYWAIDIVQFALYYLNIKIGSLKIAYIKYRCSLYLFLLFTQFVVARFLEI